MGLPFALFDSASTAEASRCRMTDEREAVGGGSKDGDDELGESGVVSGGDCVSGGSTSGSDGKGVSNQDGIGLPIVFALSVGRGRGCCSASVNKSSTPFNCGSVTGLPAGVTTSLK